MKLSNEMKIGILVTIVLLALLALTFRVGNFNVGQKGYELKIHFRQVDGVELNAPVTLNGFEVGSVKDIKILYEPETMMEVTVWLQGEAKIRKGATAYVRNMGLLGEKYIGLTAGDSLEHFLEPGSLIVGQEPMDFERLLAKGDAIADNLKELSGNLNERLRVNSAAIDEIISNIKETSKNISSISQNVNERLAVNRDAIDDIISNLNSATRNLEELSADLKLNPWKLLYRERLKKTPNKP